MGNEVIHMHLIDADELKKEAVPYVRGTYGYSAKIEDWAILVSDINKFPTIDPESLPIVKQLREEIDKLNSEIKDRERYSIEQHSAIHQYRDDLRIAKKELEIATKERSMAIEHLHGYCPACAHFKVSHGKVLCETCKSECPQCPDNCKKDNWEWIGFLQTPKNL